MGISPSSASGSTPPRKTSGAKPASEGLCPMAPSPVVEHEEKLPSPDNGAAMYWGESMMSASGMMSSMFGAAPQSPHGQSAGAGHNEMPPISTRLSRELSPVLETRPAGVFDSISTLLGTSNARTQLASSPVTTQLPVDRTMIGGAFATQVLPDNVRRGDYRSREPDPMSTFKGNEASSDLTSTLFGSRLPMFSMVGRQDRTGDTDSGPSFGPPPMIEMAREPPKEESIFQWCSICGSSPVAGK